MLDDISGVSLSLIEILFILDRLSQTQDSEDRIVELMPNAGAEHPEAARLLGLDQLVLKAALIGRVAQHESKPLTFLGRSTDSKPLIPVNPCPDVEFLAVGPLR